MLEGTVQAYPNGNMVTTPGGFMYYIPNSCNSDTPVQMYFHGAGGSYRDSQAILNQLNISNTDSIVVINQGYHTAEQNMAFVSELSQKYNLSTDSYVTTGFSAGGAPSMRDTLAYIESHPNAEPQVNVLIAASAFDSGRDMLTDANIETLIKNNATIVAIIPKGDINSVPSSYTRYAKAGLNVVVIRSLGSHVAQNDYAYQNDLISYINGDIDALAVNNGADYTYTQYNVETGEYVKVDPSVVPELVNSYRCKTLERITTKYGYLTQLGLINYTEFVTTQLSTGTNSITRSNYQYIVSTMNRLRNSIKSTSFLSSVQSFTFVSTTKMPAIIQVYLYDFYRETAELLEKLAAETQAILGIGESIQAVDEKLTAETATLTTLAASAVSPTSSYIPSNSAPITSSEPVIIPNVSGGQAETPTGSVVPKPESRETDKPSDEKFPSFEELYSTNNRRVFDCDDGSKFIVNYENGKATSIEYYYDFNTEASANSNINSLTQKYGSMENYKSISQSNNYVRVSFDASKYSNMSINEICTKFTHQSEIIRV